MNGWEKFRQEAKESKIAKFGIKNNSTGSFICDMNGNVKKFSSMDEAKLYINHHNLSSFYQIQFLGKAVDKE